MSYSHWRILLVVLLNVSSVSFDQVIYFSHFILVLIDLFHNLDFIPAVTISSSTLNSLGARTSLLVHVDGATNNEIARLYQEYNRLSEANKE
jgi:hypothetical protein